jgi:cell fate regulator YaaT (PSP1 superfamily)
MKVIDVQFTPWGKIYSFDAGQSEVMIGDFVILKTDLGIDIGKVVNISEVDAVNLNQDIKPILRKANLDDLKRVQEKEKQKLEALKVCRELVRKHNLPMKLVDAHFSFDGGRLTFAFIANGRIDFRELVKDLSQHFQRSIRLQQIGIRDSAKISGDIGLCGRPLCCQKFLKEFVSITSDIAELEQVSHRSERLCGPCGRLVCCLEFERPVYEELRKELPEIGSVINTPCGKGCVVNCHVLKRSVDVKLEEGEVVEVEIKK